MAKTHLGSMQNLDAAAAFSKLQDFADGLDKSAKVRADKKGIYGSTNKTFPLFKSKEGRTQRRQNLQKELHAIGEQCFGKSSLMSSAWTSHVNRMIDTGRLNTSVEFRGSDFQELVQGMAVAYDIAVDGGQVAPRNISVGQVIPFQFNEMADISNPLPYTAKDGEAVLSWLQNHANDHIAARETGKRTFEFYVDKGGPADKQEDPSVDIVKERANAGRALHYIGHSARIDTLRNQLQTTDDISDRQAIEQELNGRIDEYCDHYPMNASLDALASKQYLPNGGIKGQDLANWLKSQLGE